MESLLLAIFLFSLIFSSSGSADSGELPESLIDRIKTQYPGGKVLKITRCELGAKRLSSFGLIVQVGTKESGRRSPLAPAIGVKEQGRWTLKALNLHLSYERGFSRYYLDDFWDKNNGLRKDYALRCTVPDVDADISTSANGEFTKRFRSSSESGNHICFQADAVYNSWTCFGVSAETGQIENSFNQLNAD